MSKKCIPALCLALVLSALTCACGEEKPLLSPTDYDLDAETAQTIRGVKIGDGADVYHFLPAEEIPFDAKLTTILPSFFIDNTAIDVDSFCEENGIEKDGILGFLTNEEYLAHHTVVYQYLVFDWKDGVIQDIRSESMDYNKDASYYEAN